MGEADGVAGWRPASICPIAGPALEAAISAPPIATAQAAAANTLAPVFNATDPLARARTPIGAFLQRGPGRAPRSSPNP